MKRIGFIGLGKMGKGICMNLVNKGYSVSVFDLSKDAMRAFDGLAHLCNSTAEVLERSDYVFLALPNSKIVSEIVEGFLLGDVSNKTIIDTSTSSPIQTRELYKKVKKAGGGYVDAALNATPQQAEKGEVISVVGGDKEDVDAIHDLLMSYCKQYEYYGESGSGNLIKIALNYSGLVQVLAYAQLYPIMEKYGIKPELLYQSFNNDGYSNSVFQFYSQKYIQKDFRMDFEMPLALKDLTYMKLLCDNINIPAFLLDGAIDLLRVALKENPDRILDVSYACKTMYEFVGLDHPPSQTSD